MTTGGEVGRWRRARATLRVGRFAQGGGRLLLRWRRGAALVAEVRAGFARRARAARAARLVRARVGSGVAVRVGVRMGVRVGVRVGVG